MSGARGAVADYLAAGWRVIPVPAGTKAARRRGWPDLIATVEDFRDDDNVAIVLGDRSGGIVDVDLDAPEALVLADLYLPVTGAEFGRLSKPRSHRLYQAPGSIFNALADPLTGEMLLELRADGRDGGAHLTLLPPSVTSGERREWVGDTVIPTPIDAAVLARRVIWLAIGALVFRHVSEQAARRPGPDMPAMLWETDHALGRAAFHWLDRRAPDEPRRYPRPRWEMSREELDLAELVAAIQNTFGWEDWNKIGLAIYAASNGSEDGRIAFDDLSAKSSKYNARTVQERWKNYRRSPPSRIGIGTLVHLARQAGWRRTGSAA